MIPATPNAPTVEPRDAAFEVLAGEAPLEVLEAPLELDDPDEEPDVGDDPPVVVVPLLPVVVVPLLPEVVAVRQLVSLPAKTVIGDEKACVPVLSFKTMVN